MSTDLEAAINAGYGFDGPAIAFGAAMKGEEALPAAQVRVPLSMLNRQPAIFDAVVTDS